MHELLAPVPPECLCPVCQRALALATAHGDNPLQLDAQYRLSRAYFFRGDAQQVIPLLTQIVESLTGDLEHAFLGYSLPLAVASRVLLTCALAMCGAFPEGLTQAKEAGRIVEAVDHPWSHMFAAQALAWLSLAKGDFTHAIAAFERILALGQRAEIPGIFPEIAAALGLAYAWSGRVTQALPLVEQAMARHQVMTEMAPASGLVLHLGHVYLLAGRLDEASNFARQALDLSRKRQERGIQAHVLWLLGDITARREPRNDEQAQRFYGQALDLAKELGWRPLQAHCHRSLGTLYSHRGWLELAHTELTMAVHLYRAMDMTFWLPQAEAALAQVCRQGEAMNTK